MLRLFLFNELYRAHLHHPSDIIGPGSACWIVGNLQLIPNFPEIQMSCAPLMATDDQKREIAQKFLTALRNRDWNLLKSILAPDVVWSLPGTSVISGTAEGVDAVIKRSQLLTSYGLNFSLNHILYGQNGLALSLNNTAKRWTLVLDEHLATVCSLREDRISRIDTYLSDVAMVEAFFV